MTLTGIHQDRSIGVNHIKDENKQDGASSLLKKRQPTLPRMVLLGEQHLSSFSSKILRSLIYRLLEQDKKVTLCREEDAQLDTSFQNMKARILNKDDVENFMAGIKEEYLPDILRKDKPPTNKALCDAFYNLGEVVEKADPSLYKLLCDPYEFLIEGQDYLDDRKKKQKDEFHNILSDCLKKDFSHLFKDEYLSLSPVDDTIDNKKRDRFERTLLEIVRRFASHINMAYVSISHKNFEYNPIDLARESMSQIASQFSDDVKQISSVKKNDEDNHLLFLDKNGHAVHRTLSKRISLLFRNNGQMLSSEEADKRLKTLKGYTHEDFLLSVKLRDIAMLDEVNKMRLDAQKQNHNDDSIFIMVVGDTHRKNIENNYISASSENKISAFNITKHRKHSDTPSKNSDQIVNDIIQSSGISDHDPSKDNRSVELFPSEGYQMLEAIISIYQQPVEKRERKKFPKRPDSALMQYLYTLTPHKNGETGL